MAPDPIFRRTGRTDPVVCEAERWVVEESAIGPRPAPGDTNDAGLPERRLGEENDVRTVLRQQRVMDRPVCGRIAAAIIRKDLILLGVIHAKVKAAVRYVSFEA